MKRLLALGLGLLATVSCGQSPEAVKREALLRAEQYQKHGQIDEAIIEWREALRVDPSLVAARHALGRAYASKLWYRDAATELLVAQELSPQSVAISAELGRVLVELGAWKRARAQAERIQSSEPSNQDALYIRGAALLGEGRADELLSSRDTPAGLRASALLELGRLTEAEAAYRALLIEHPADVQALAGLGEVNLRQRRYRQAVVFFERADTVRPGDPKIRIRFAAARVRLGQLLEAIKVLEGIHPRARSGGTLIALGWCYLRAHRPREVVQLLTPLVDQAPRWVELRFLLGASHLASGNPAAAVPELEQADRQSAGDPLIRLRLAAAYTRVGRPQDALATLGALAGGAQQLADYHIEQSRALLRLGRLDDAHAAAETARRLAPQAPPPYLLLGQIEARLGKPERARMALAKALQLDSAYAPAHLELGRLRAAEGNMDAALEAFDVALRADPTSATTLRAKTAGLVAQKRASEAIRFVEAAVSADDRSADLHALLGSVYAEQQAFGPARAAFRRALELDPRPVLPHLGLADLAVRAGHTVEAVGHLRAALKEWPAEPTAVLWLASLHRGEGQYDQAIGILEAALKTAPGHRAFSLVLGELYVMKGRYGEAIARMSDLLAREPHLVAAHLTRARAYAATGQSEAAIRDVTEATRTAPRSAALHYHLARIYTVAGRVPEAQGAYRKAIELDPGLETAKIELAVLSHRRLDEAVWRRRLDQLQAAVRAQPGSVEDRDALARTLMAQGNVAAAQRELRHILERTPGHAEANYLVARVLLSQGKLDDAAEHLKTALRASPSHVAAHMLLARQLLARGQREQAALHLAAALQVNPTLAAAKLDLGMLYAQDGRLEQAFELARQLRRDEVANPRAPLLMGVVLLAQGRPREAVDAFATTIKMNPDLIEAHRGLGRAHEALGQTDRAMASYERALALDGRDVFSLTSLASILRETRTGSDRALALATRAAQLRPTAPDVLDTLGWIHYRRGAYAEAESALARAVERAPENARIRYHLGMAYARLGRASEAVSALRDAARLDAGLARREKLEEVISGLGG